MFLEEILAVEFQPASVTAEVAEALVAGVGPLGEVLLFLPFHFEAHAGVLEARVLSQEVHVPEHFAAVGAFEGRVASVYSDQ